MGTLEDVVLHGHAEWVRIQNLMAGNLIHTLELKLWHFEVFLYICLYREAMHLQCFLPTRYVRGGATCAQ